MRNKIMQSEDEEDESPVYRKRQPDYAALPKAPQSNPIVPKPMQKIYVKKGSMQSEEFKYEG